MTILDKKMIRYLSELSRIGCTEDEEEKLLHDLKSILEYIEALDEIDTSSAAPCNHVLEGIVNVMREDVVKEVMPRELFLSNAPSQIGGLIRVPPVIKQG
jgi:aspartyl-tRNA(Asn)/glutamyl-tRNA(Gln) amidotransferase subunit C